MLGGEGCVLLELTALNLRGKVEMVQPASEPVCPGGILETPAHLSLGCSGHQLPALLGHFPCQHIASHCSLLSPPPSQACVPEEAWWKELSPWTAQEMN